MCCSTKTNLIHLHQFGFRVDHSTVKSEKVDIVAHVTTECAEKEVLFWCVFGD